MWCYQKRLKLQKNFCFSICNMEFLNWFYPERTKADDFLLLRHLTANLLSASLIIQIQFITFIFYNIIHYIRLRNGRFERASAHGLRNSPDNIAQRLEALDGPGLSQARPQSEKSSHYAQLYGHENTIRPQQKGRGRRVFAR